MMSQKYFRLCGVDDIFCFVSIATQQDEPHRGTNLPNSEP